MCFSCMLQHQVCFVVYQSTNNHGIKRTSFKNGWGLFSCTESKYDTALLYFFKKSKIEHTEVPMGGVKHTCSLSPSAVRH